MVAGVIYKLEATGISDRPGISVWAMGRGAATSRNRLEKPWHIPLAHM